MRAWDERTGASRRCAETALITRSLVQLAWARLAASGASHQLLALWERTTVCQTGIEPRTSSGPHAGLLLTRLSLASDRSRGGDATFSSAPSRSTAKRPAPPWRCPSSARAWLLRLHRQVIGRVHLAALWAARHHSQAGMPDHPPGARPTTASAGPRVLEPAASTDLPLLWSSRFCKRASRTYAAPRPATARGGSRTEAESDVELCVNSLLITHEIARSPQHPLLAALKSGPVTQTLPPSLLLRPTKNGSKNKWIIT